LPSRDWRCEKTSDVKTMAQDFAVDVWVGVFAPASTPAAIVERLSQEINPIAASGSELTEEEQNYQNDNNKPDDAAGSVPPAPAVPPRRKHAHQSQDKNDKKDGADTHL
jgi:Tripartite tricarboxylate transporter family receptor